MGSQTASLLRKAPGHRARPLPEIAPAPSRPRPASLEARKPDPTNESSPGPSLRSLASIPIFAFEQRALASDAKSSGSRLPIQFKLAIGAANDPLESEADAMAAGVMKMAAKAQAATSSAGPVLRRKCSCAGGEPCDKCKGEQEGQVQRKATASVTPTEAPPIVHEVLHSPGQPLDSASRAFFEPRFGRDLSGVRVHTEPRAQESARAVNALAYTVGEHTVFAAGQYRPGSGEGRKLLAHELSHTVQQSRDSAAVVVQRQEATPAKTDKKPEPVEASVFVSWDDPLYQKLILPSLLQPRPQPGLLPSPGTLTLGEKPQPGWTLPPGSIFNFPQIGAGSQSQSPLPPLATPSPLVSPSAAPSGQSSAAPSAAPSRVSLANLGRGSLGVRLGFPDLSPSEPGAPPTLAQQALQRAEILNEIRTGQIPTAWQMLDKGKLAGAIWGIFSTHIAPDVARKITSSLSGKAGPKGVSYELDGVILTDFSGGGVSLTLKY